MRRSSAVSEISTLRLPERAVPPPVADLPPPVPATARADDAPRPTKLEPAVTVDLSGSATRRPAGSEIDYQAKFVRDSDTQRIVFQVVDPASGTVVEQLPSLQALKERAYSEARERAADLAPVAESQRPLDLIA
jgi:flagellar protein FlaG